MKETIENTTTAEDSVPSRHVVPVFAGAKLLKGYVLDDQDKLWILDVEDNFVPAPVKETWTGDKVFHDLCVGFSWCQPERNHMSLEQIILGSKAKSAAYEKRYGRTMVPETRFRETGKGSYKTVVPVYDGNQVVPNFYMDVYRRPYNSILYYLKDGILMDVKGAMQNGQFIPAGWLISNTVQYYRSAEDAFDVPSFKFADLFQRSQPGMSPQTCIWTLPEVADRVPVWRAGRYLGASELQQMVLHVPAVGNSTGGVTGLQQPSGNGNPAAGAPGNTDVGTATACMSLAMAARGFSRYQIDSVVNEFTTMCLTRQTRMLQRESVWAGNMS